MRSNRISLAALTAAVVLAGCADRGAERDDLEQDAVPVGTEVSPPRGAQETGSLTVPGQEPETPLIAGEEADTVQ